jgi:drug/metabolite transporter (DMT)-like permease
MTSSATQRRLAYFAWIAVCLLWGTTYLGIRISLESIPPALMGGMRWSLAGAALALYVIAKGGTLPPPSRWGQLFLLGFLMLGLGNGGVVFAEQWVPSGLAAVIVATAPFWMAAVEALLPDGERLRPRVIAGLIVGFGGIVLLVWPDVTLGSATSRSFLAGIAALQIAAIGWSIGSAQSKRYGSGNGLDVIAMTAYQMIAGGIIMTVAGTLLGEWSHLHFTTRTTIAFLYLTTFGAIGGFLAYTYALRHLPVSFVSLYAYINPIIAVALGVIVLHEPFTWRMASAAALVFAGVAIVRWQSASLAFRRSSKMTDAQDTPGVARRTA